MNKDKILSLFHDEDFIAELNDANGIDGIVGAFKNRNIHIDETKAKVIMSALEIANEKMYEGESIEDNRTEEITGGSEIKIAKMILNSKLGGNSKYGDIISGQAKLNSSLQDENDAKDISEFLN